MIAIHDYLSEERVLFLETNEKDAVLGRLVDRAADSGNVIDASAFREAVFQREAVVSTGIGQSIAIPHVKHRSVREFFITIGVSREGIDWTSIDRKPVHIVFLIAGPEDHEHYLQILSKVMLVARNGDLRQKIVGASSETKVLEHFRKL